MGNNVRRILGNRRLLSTAAFFVLSIFGLVILSGKLLLSFQAASAARAQEQQIEQYLMEYDQKSKAVQNALHRPIAAEKVDALQAQLLLTVKALNLQLHSLKNLKTDGKKQTRDRMYEMTVQGSWASLVHLLEYFPNQAALMTVQQVKMKAEKDGSIQSTLRYKIYTLESR